MSKSINFDKNYAMRSFLFIAFLCFCCTGLFAQDSLGWLAYPGEQVDTLTEGKIEVNADKRIDKFEWYASRLHVISLKYMEAQFFEKEGLAKEESLFNLHERINLPLCAF